METIQKVYGNDIAKSLYPLKNEGVAFSFKGFISKPEVSYSKRYNLLTFLNNRCIYDYKINKAIEDAYRDYLPPLRYPFALICLDIDPSLVDVNVHPTKKEVRISLEDDMARDIRDTIISTLKNQRPIYEASQDSKVEKDLKIDDSAFDIDDLKEEEKKKSVSYIDEKPLCPNDTPHFFQDVLPVEPTYESQTVQEEKKEETVSSYPYEKTDMYKDIFKEENISNKLPEMHPLGQILHTYIVCDSNDCFYLIDQHAAAERINYEKTEALFSSIRSRVVPLFPLTVDLSFKELQNYDEEHKALLLSVGIVTEPFGDKTIKVSEIPSFLASEDDGVVLQDSIHSCLNNESFDPQSLLKLTIANIACKKSIKANHQMSLLEIQGLLNDLAKCKNPANCPHGRPTLIKISRDDIEKIFRRSGF